MPPPTSPPPHTPATLPSPPAAPSTEGGPSCRPGSSGSAGDEQSHGWHTREGLSPDQSAGQKRQSHRATTTWVCSWQSRAVPDSQEAETPAPTPTLQEERPPASQAKEQEATADGYTCSSASTRKAAVCPACDSSGGACPSVSSARARARMCFPKIPRPVLSEEVLQPCIRPPKNPFIAPDSHEETREPVLRLADPPAKGVAVEDAPKTHNERPVLSPLVALGSVSDPPGPPHDRRSSRLEPQRLRKGQPYLFWALSPCPIFSFLPNFFLPTDECAPCFLLSRFAVFWVH